jgi:superfamily II DNA or RNA helicase
VLRAKWGRVPIERLAATLGASVTACRLRATRLGISTRDCEDFSIRRLEELTGVDHRQWRYCLAQGWLRSSWEQPRNGATPILRVSVEALHDLLRRKPEVFDYRRASHAAISALRLNELPDPPRFKRLACRSESYAGGARLSERAAGGPGERRPEFFLPSCEEIGGTRFWAPTYESAAACPRCGCRVSRYSEGKGKLYSDLGDDDAALAAVAAKLGLVWKDGGLFDARGNRIRDEELLRHVFDGRRRAQRAFRVFRAFLKAGLKVGRSHPIPPKNWLPDITGLVLRRDQVRAFETLQAEGRVGVYIPPGQGKSALGCYVLTRLSGRHVVFVPSRVLRDQWVRSFKALCTKVAVRTVYRPVHFVEVTVYDRRGEVRSTIEIFSYQTRFDFGDKEYACRVFDEAQFVPGNRAIALLYQARASWQLSLTATPFREDGRADVIDILSAATIGADWSEYRARGEIRDVPVSVLVVPNEEAKFQRLKSLIDRSERTLIFSDYVRTGKRIALDLRIPFVYSRTAGKLATLMRHRTVAVSRTGDCGLSLPDVAHVIEVCFHGGSRAQSLQRHGRLLHGEHARLHTVLMTPQELQRFRRRLAALESRGIRVELKWSSGKPGRPSVASPSMLQQGRAPAKWCDILPRAA